MQQVITITQLAHLTISKINNKSRSISRKIIFSYYKIKYCCCQYGQSILRRHHLIPQHVWISVIVCRNKSDNKLTLGKISDTLLWSCICWCSLLKHQVFLLIYQFFCLCVCRRSLVSRMIVVTAPKAGTRVAAGPTRSLFHSSNILLTPALPGWTTESFQYVPVSARDENVGVRQPWFTLYLSGAKRAFGNLFWAVGEQVNKWDYEMVDMPFGRPDVFLTVPDPSHVL